MVQSVSKAWFWASHLELDSEFRFWVLLFGKKGLGYSFWSILP